MDALDKAMEDKTALVRATLANKAPLHHMVQSSLDYERLQGAPQIELTQNRPYCRFRLYCLFFCGATGSMHGSTWGVGLDALFAF